MSGHYQGLGGAAVLVTEGLLDARELIGGISDAQAMGAIYGPAGTGKSFAVTEVLTDRTDRDWVHTDFRCRPTLRYVRQELARLLGIPEAGRLGPFEADWSLKHALSGAFQLLVIDEAQWLNRECFEYLRHLHDSTTIPTPTSRCCSWAVTAAMRCCAVNRCSTPACMPTSGSPP